VLHHKTLTAKPVRFSVGILDVPGEDEMVEYLKERKRKRLEKQAATESQIKTA